MSNDLFSKNVNENTISCPDCYGKGYLEDWDGGAKKCAMCNGIGRLTIPNKETSDQK